MIDLLSVADSGPPQTTDKLMLVRSAGAYTITFGEVADVLSTWNAGTVGLLGPTLALSAGTLDVAGSTFGVLASVNAWTAAQRGVPVALADTARIAIDLSLGNNFTLTLGGNRTLGNPTNITAGQAGQIVIRQDATGARTLAYSSDWKFAAGTMPTLSTAANAIDILSYYVIDTTNIAVSPGLNFS